MNIVLKTIFSNNVDPRIIESDLAELGQLGLVVSDLTDHRWLEAMLSCARMAFINDFDSFEHCDLILMANHISYATTINDSLSLDGIQNGFCLGKFTFLFRNKMYVTSSLASALGARSSDSEIIDLY